LVPIDRPKTSLFKKVGCGSREEKQFIRTALYRLGGEPIHNAGSVRLGARSWQHDNGPQQREGINLLKSAEANQSAAAIAKLEEPVPGIGEIVGWQAFSRQRLSQQRHGRFANWAGDEFGNRSCAHGRHLPGKIFHVIRQISASKIFAAVWR
jgi:hypothetical protein